MMRDEEEINEAHDIIGLTCTQGHFELWEAALTTICWVLKHEHDGGIEFQQRLNQLKDQLNEQWPNWRADLESSKQEITARDN